jgi:hypothetical protein
VQDHRGRPVPSALVEIYVNGRPRGTVNTGWGVNESTVTISDANASVDVKVAVADEVQQAHLGPGQDSIRFEFRAIAGLPWVPSALLGIWNLLGIGGSMTGLAGYFGKAPPVARCPDGTTGSPCVLCRDGDETWRICT